MLTGRFPHDSRLPLIQRRGRERAGEQHLMPWCYPMIPFDRPRALSAWNQSSWGEPTGQPRFSHNSWASLPTVSWSGLKAVRLACDPTVFRVSFPCLDMNRRSSLSIRHLDGYPSRLRPTYVLLITFHGASEWPLKTSAIPPISGHLVLILP